MPAKTFNTIINKAQTPTGCGVLVLRDGKVLTGTRIERASRGQICGPGGHIEPGETPEEAARREAYEEFHIRCHDLKPLGTQDGGGRYGTSAVFLCTDYTGTPKTDEEEMTNPKWLTINQIRRLDVFPPFADSLELLQAEKTVEKGDDMEIPKQDVKILKTDEDQHLVFGWASVAITVDGEELEDRQHDMIEPEDLEEAAYEYVLNFRDTGEEHLPGYRKKGKLVESCVFTKDKQKAMGIPEGTLPVAWWIGFKIEDEDTWQRVKNGTYRMFSIEGKAEREPVEKAAYDEWLEENMDKFSSEEEERKFAQWKSDNGFTARNASDVDEIDGQWERYKREVLRKADSTAQTFEEILKFNPYHDALGRFTHANAMGARASLRGKTENGQRLLDQFKEKHGGKASGGGGGSSSKDPHEGMEFDHMHGVWVPKKPKQPQKPGNFQKIDNAEAEDMAIKMGQTRDQMSEKDYDAMTGWDGYINTGNSFSINDQLRKGVKIEDMSPTDRAACEAMDRNMKPSPQDIKVTRLCGSSMLESLGIKDVWNVGGIPDKDLKAAEGQVYSQEGYSSTSFDIGENVFMGRPVKMNINVPKGANMLISPTRDWNDQITEAEIILPRNCPMLIKKVRRTTSKDGANFGDPIIEIDIDVLLD